jgi:hypothetical protein
MHKNVFKLFFLVFLLLLRKTKSALMKLLIASTLVLFSAMPVESPPANAQENNVTNIESVVSVKFNNLTINKIEEKSLWLEGSIDKDLRFEPLTVVEENVARNLNSHWVWSENTLEMIDSFSPFLFRTKKSQVLEEVIVLLNVNSKGIISNFEVLGKIDKGLEERLDHMIRKMPACKPVPGYTSYAPAQFQLTIKK